MTSSTAIVRAIGLVLLIAAIVSPGQCLKCYKCKSDEDPSCGSNPKQVSNCENIPQLKDLTMGMLDMKPVCLKSVVKDKGSSRRITVRDCAADTTVAKACDIVSLPILAGVEIEVCETCTTDLCNGGSQLLLSLAVFLLPCVISLVHSLM